MSAPSFLCRKLVAACALLALLFPPAQAGVVINELVASASERLLRFPAGAVARFGTGVAWYEPAYDDAGWQTAAGPFGYGAISNNPTAIAKNLQTSVQYLTTSAYFRKSFNVSAADKARADAVQLVVQYNDGFVAYLNGVEIARRNGGPAGKFIYHDQPAYNREAYSGTVPIPTAALAETISLGAASSSALVAGTNVLAIQLLNASAADATFYLKADLRISGSPLVNLVNFNDAWKFFPGVVEPSGNLFDPALLGTGKQFVPWGTVGFDDATWSSGAGPFGFGSVSGNTITTNPQAAMLNVTPSLYTRVVFTATAAQAADALPLKLLVRNDDGFVAYINGVEVARRRIGTPNTFTPRDAVADGDQTSVQVETITLDAASKLLVEGENVLAIQAHNFTASDSNFYMRTDLQTNASVTLVVGNAPCSYLVGTVEPIPSVTGEEEESAPDGPETAADWIELHNNGASDVSLAGWSLTDDGGIVAKWVFPAGTTIPAGGYLVVVADGKNLTSNPGGYLHTNFSLSGEGEYLALFDQLGQLQSQLAPAYPPQVTFYSYARNGAGAWRYSDTPSPGAANGGNFLDGIVANPAASLPGRFYTGVQSVTLTCPTPGATIRYTTDGSEPKETSTVAAAAINLTTNTPLRARAFLAGSVPSATITNTYLINQSSARRSLPAISLVGDSAQTFYRPYGVFAIVNNSTVSPTNYTGGIWSNHPNATTLNPVDTPEDPNLYNAPMQSGKPAERPLSVEMLHTDAKPDLRIGAYIRCAGSPYSRQRYVLDNHNSGAPNGASPWPGSATQKPQLNLFFRDDVGPHPVTYPFVPISPISQYENIRLRAGKNDIVNPFIRDEFTRRLMVEMGQVSVLGDFCNVYVNGVFKGYFNTCQRPREPFFQQARDSDLRFDVRNITVIADGDTLAYNELMNYAQVRNMAVPADYLGMQARLDVVNFADYILLNVHAAMADWPGNNYVMDRERSAAGLWRFSVWDAEGGYGGFSRNPAYKSFNDIYSSNTDTVPAKRLYTVLRNSPEFRLLFADRIQKHFFNGGALSDANLQAEFTTLAARIQPIMSEVTGQTVSQFLNIWINGQGDTTRYTLSGGTSGSIVNSPSRRTALFSGYQDDVGSGGAAIAGFFPEQGLWPLTLAPTYSQFGGAVAQNYSLTITNPNGTGTIYYTANGVDPRAVGGAPQGTAYTGPITISQSTIVKARVRSAAGVWSPLVEAAFTTPNPAPLLITEIMYNPPDLGGVDGGEFEFVEIKNAGASTVSLAGMNFSAGIDFTFPAGATLAPGAFLLLAKNAAQFAVKYPGLTALGSYGPATSLSNSGETLTLKDTSGNTVFSVAYGDGNVAGWPSSPDGGGRSLAPVYTNTNPNPNAAEFWRASANVNGSPGADDPMPVIAPVVINEVLANPAAGQKDAIELFNPTGSPVDIGNWWLSNLTATPRKFRIPANTIMPAGGYLVFDETAFNPTPGAGASFALNPNGDTVVLSAGGTSGALAGYNHTITFGAATAGTSLGPYQPIIGPLRWLPQSALTLGAANSGPLVGPVVITELMYNPVAGNDEFIELRNITGTPVPLHDVDNPTSTWRIVGVSYNFPQGTVLQPRQVAILTPVAPATFRTKYNVPDSIPVFQYSAVQNLANAGELISLQRALGQPAVYSEVDSVTYSSGAPWPAAANGAGPSLERVNAFAFADDAGNWRASMGSSGIAASGGTPGRPTALTVAQWQALYFTAAETADPNIGGLTADIDGDGLSNLLEYAYDRNPLVPDAMGISTMRIALDAGNGPYLTLEYRRTLSWMNLEFHHDTAGDLHAAWTLDGAVQIGAPAQNDDGTETVIVRDTVPSIDGVPRFLRLRVKSN